jgi:hypothetical protein
MKKTTSYERSQRRQTLAVVIWIILVAAIILGTLNVQYGLRDGKWDSAITLFSLAAFCVPALWLNARGHFIISASIISLIALLAINANLIDGDGIRDPGILAYPIFIMSGTLFFGKRAAPYFTLAAIASLFGIAYLEMHGAIQPSIGTTKISDLLPLVILILVAGLIIRVIVHNMEKDLEKARLSEAELRKSYDQTLDAWARVLEYRDRETEGHSRRLVELSTRLSQALGLGEEEIVHMRYGALMHDIGKLAIPDQILLKPNKLEDDEKEIIRKHPALAKQMLSGIPFLQPAVIIAYSHHEYWDGQGYPEGLKGEEIPLYARIFSVVDTWDALNSDRPYRPAWSKADALAYIKNNRGIIFDPHIVDVFLQIIK